MDKDRCLNIFEKYLSGKATSEEVVELHSFLEKDKQLGTWMENEIMVSPDQVDSNIRMRMLENIRLQTSNYSKTLPNNKRREKKQISFLRWSANIAAVLFPVLLVLGAYLYLHSPEVQSFEIKADLGEKASLTLSEGTKISINSDSRIVYNSDYNKENRFIILDGEAFFDVKQDSKKPFIVQCKDLKIVVLGTSFDVKAYENEENVAIVLNSGKIQLATPKEQIEMKPNERVLYNKLTQNISLQKVNAEDYTDWQQNRLRFEDESLEMIMKTISRMHNIEIVFDDSNIQSKRFTGTIDNTNIERVLNAIMLTSSTHYKMQDGVIHLYN